MEQIQAHADNNVNKILIGNKFDLAQKRVVTHDEGLSLAKEFKIPFYETSAVNNTNVDQAFMTLVQDIKVRLDVEAQDMNRPSRASETTKKTLPRNNTTKKLTDTKKKSSSWC
jgi:GTPase SAR1 family protein